MIGDLGQYHALIGHSGFVGSTLKRQHQFTHAYRSTDIQDITGLDLDVVICAGAPAKKWVANQHPEEDWACIERLINILSTIKVRQFVLISTVDIFKHPVGVDELSSVDVADLHPYGMHRRKLEQFVEQHFPSKLIVRLPGLVGPGLRKNVIYDFHHNNDLHKIDHRAVFQFYPMINLWYDIRQALSRHLELVHLTAEPISVGEMSEAAFGKTFETEVGAPPPVYDFQSVHASLFGGTGHYQYSKRETIQAIRAYAQSEPFMGAVKP